MTRSYGGGGPERQKDKEPKLRESEGGWQRKLDSLSRYSSTEETSVQAVRVDFGKRLVALILDIFAAYIVAAALGMVPLINVFVTTQLAMILVLLIRDYFFEGRGIGKNLMGLQVVDVMSGLPCSFLQSIKRNIIVLGPLLALYIIMLFIHVINVVARESAALISDLVIQIINTVGALYTVVVIPYEAYRVYNQADGRRFGDQFAGTAVIEAPMDFSKPLPRQ